MANFSVAIRGVTEEGQGRWVFAVNAERDRLLDAYADRTLHWHDISECTFVGMVNPAGVQPVVVVRPGPPPGPLGDLTLPPINGGGP